MKVYILLVFGFVAMSEASKIGLGIGKTLAKLEHNVETVGTAVLHHIGVTKTELAKMAKELEAFGEEVEEEVEEEAKEEGVTEEEVEKEVEEEAKEEGVTEKGVEKELGVTKDEEAIIGEVTGTE